MQLSDIKKMGDRVKENIAKVIVGKEENTELALICLIAGGHMLLEDVPGTGKTLFARSLAQSTGCGFKRIQFTPDLLPGDITGIHFYNQKDNSFTFRPGAVFTNIVLADEINRATPRTQSALLESMEERQVTIDGETMKLSAPFMVIATQNPVETKGTFPLPEAQLDRFLVKANVGYPSGEEGVEILRRFKDKSPLETLSAVLTAEEIVDAQQSYSACRVVDDIYRYIIAIADATRASSLLEIGVSPRGTQALLRAVQVRAILQGRDYVQPDDVKALAGPVLAHRLVLSYEAKGRKAADILAEILAKVPVPAENVANA